MVRPVFHRRKKDSRYLVHLSAMKYFGRKYPTLFVLPASEPEYVVERIVDKRTTATNVEYLIKWHGYSS